MDLRDLLRLQAEFAIKNSTIKENKRAVQTSLEEIKSKL